MPTPGRVDLDALIGELDDLERALRAVPARKRSRFGPAAAVTMAVFAALALVVRPSLPTAADSARPTGITPVTLLAQPVTGVETAAGAAPDEDAETQPPEAEVPGVPPDMLALYRDGAATCPGLPWSVLAAIGMVESAHGALASTSSAGAEGPMQFLPSTWATFGIDADGDDVADIHDRDDAVVSAARFLCAHDGADPDGLPGAVYRYNPLPEYVDAVLSLAARYEGRAEPA